MEKIYRIYPPIGIARIGRSDEWFIGPESPTMPVEGPFKKNDQIKKQGCRFRIYEFEVDEFGGEEIIREVTNSDSVKIRWDVQLCNRKAASRRVPNEPANGLINRRNEGYIQDALIINGFGEISGEEQQRDRISGRIQFIREVDNRLDGEAEVVLGYIETDSDGRLIVLGGDGDSGSPLSRPIVEFANNPGWYDDCCDGPIGAIIEIDGQSVEAERAWAVIASPAYAPEIFNVITWYDQARNVDAEFFNPILKTIQPSFTYDIYPILKRAALLKWVSGTATGGHGQGRPGDFLDPDALEILAENSEQGNTRARHIFNRLMVPNTQAPNFQSIPGAPENMPLLYSGVDPMDRSQAQFASLTPLQYSMMEKWSEGDFVEDWEGERMPVAFFDIPLVDQPDALTEAALSGCIGGPFFPGIETTYIMTLPETYDSPYRINQTVPAGYITELMAVPWQADFVDCGALWWPAQRPVMVYTANGVEEFSRGIPSGRRRYSGMLRNWNELGFVVRDGDDFIESERGIID